MKMGTKMVVKAVFYIKPKEDEKIQNIGYRLFIQRKMMDLGFTKGNVENLPDGRVKGLIEGEKQKIEEFIKQIKEEKPDDQQSG